MIRFDLNKKGQALRFELLFNDYLLWWSSILTHEGKVFIEIYISRFKFLNGALNSVINISRSPTKEVVLAKIESKVYVANPC